MPAAPAVPNEGSRMVCSVRCRLKYRFLLVVKAVCSTVEVSTQHVKVK